MITHKKKARTFQTILKKRVAITESNWKGMLSHIDRIQLVQPNHFICYNRDSLVENTVHTRIEYNLLFETSTAAAAILSIVIELEVTDIESEIGGSRGLFECVSLSIYVELYSCAYCKSTCYVCI